MNNEFGSSRFTGNYINDVGDFTDKYDISANLPPVNVQYRIKRPKNVVFLGLSAVAFLAGSMCSTITPEGLEPEQPSLAEGSNMETGEIADDDEFTVIEYPKGEFPVFLDRSPWPCDSKEREYLISEKPVRVKMKDGVRIELFAGRIQVDNTELANNLTVDEGWGNSHLIIGTGGRTNSAEIGICNIAPDSGNPKIHYYIEEVIPADN